MRSSNPVFTNRPGFNGRTTITDVGAGRMTLDSVVEKTGITLAVLTAAAAVVWFWIGSTVDSAGYADSTRLSQAYAVVAVASIVGFVLSLVNSFKRVVSPALVLAYAAAEGAFVGGLSKSLTGFVGDNSIVFGAVLGTVAAFGGTLVAYKFFNIQVGDRFRKVVTAAMFGFVGVSLLDLVLSLFGHSFGFNGFGPMGLISSVLAVVIAVFMLVLDFDYVEQGIRAGLPARESWRAAFGLTVTIVWLYVELLRILAILRGND